MPAALTYPGVYVEEISSGVRTIMGVSTSVTAFIGRAKKGPVDKATTINNFGDYERIFGGLDLKSMMSYAVRDFYLNGGSQAVIVRLAKEAAKSKNDALKLEAFSEGEHGNKLTYTVDRENITDDIAKRYQLNRGDLFNLTVYENGEEPNKGRVESFLNVSVNDAAGARRLDRVLETESNLVRVQKEPNGTPDLAGKPTNSAKNESPTYEGDDKKLKEFTTGKDSDPLDVENYNGSKNEKTGLYALEQIDLFNLLCIPPDTQENDPVYTDAVYKTAMSYCNDRRAMLIVNSPSDWKNKESATQGIKEKSRDKNAALFFPRLMQPNPLRGNQIEEFVPCGAVAGIIARTDAQRGFWKAPAGIDATLRGVSALSVELTNDENGELNPLGINCLRSFPNVGKVVWGARTLRGADILTDEWKYLPVRRTALYIEESLYRGTQWVVFEPNDEPLWAQIRLNVGAFMHNLFRKGAFQGTTPKEAYFVKCDKETNPQNDIDRGIINIMVGFAPLKPAEFVVIKLQQIAGDLQM
jgi:phage tail sheath protein FI